MAQAPPLYALRVDPEGLARVRLDWPPGRPLAELLLLSSAHGPDTTDELVRVEPVEVRAIDEKLVEVSQAATSTLWEHKRAVLRSYPDRLEYWLELRGRGALDEVTFFEAGEQSGLYARRWSPSGWWRPPRARSGWQGSRAHFSRVFNPAPNGAFRQYGWPGERLTIQPGNESTWGGDWFFTPAPFAFGLGDEGRWATVGLGCRAEQATFYHFDFRGGPLFGFGLTYQGYTRVDGAWRSPTVVIIPTRDEWVGLEAYAAWLRDGGYDANPGSTPEPWWTAPIWCGWGEQVALETPERPARLLSTQANYDTWLAHLAERRLRPGTIVVDDRWMARLGYPEPHLERWPDLAGFIDGRHAAGQRVLIWHNAWEAEGGPESGRVGEWESGSGGGPDLITYRGQPALGAFGAPLMDPTGRRTETHLREVMVRLLAPPPYGLGADGLKVDITHSTPSGPGYLVQGGSWGNALLHRLLALTYRLAKEVKPTALVECHAANPLFRDTADVLRLNDLHTDLGSVVEMMRHRARVGRAAGWELIDCDGWPLPSKAALLEYVRAQPEIGIPALYYVTRVDQTGEALEERELGIIADVWQDYRRPR